MQPGSRRFPVLVQELAHSNLRLRLTHWKLGLTIPGQEASEQLWVLFTSGSRTEQMIDGQTGILLIYWGCGQKKIVNSPVYLFSKPILWLWASSEGSLSSVWGKESVAHPGGVQSGVVALLHQNWQGEVVWSPDQNTSLEGRWSQGGGWSVPRLFPSGMIISLNRNHHGVSPEELQEMAK